MRKLRAFLCLAFVCLMMTEPVFAAPRLNSLASAGASSAINGITSRVMVSPDITADEAAERLYYLGLMSGTGTVNGKVHFALDLPITRLETMVMTIRLLGMETEVLSTPTDHPFTDVPDWGAPYVSYFWANGLLDNKENGLLWPDNPVSTNHFMRYMYYALGYSDEDDSNLATKASFYAIQAGICTESKSEITRGDAALMIFRTLNTSCAGTDKMLSELFVENEYLGYQDAMFLLWCVDCAQSAAYIKQCGYTTEKILPDGKYTIVLNDSTRCLNVLVDGGNNDYEGVGVTVWKRTDDISQKFRVERTERGTYRLFSCASGGGFHRLLGISRYGTSALFSSNSSYAGEYYIRYSDSGNGSWQFISASDSTKCLGSTDARNGAAVVLCDIGDPAHKTEWTFEFDGVVNEEGLEFALFPSETLCITQGAYDHYSHQRQNALDMTTSNGSVYAPFTGEIVRIDRGYSRYNTVWLQSCDKVVYADGSTDYMTVIFMHDNNVADLKVGQIVAQGEYFYDSGVAGGATGSHVHIAVYRGKYVTGSSLTGSGNVYVQDALFLPTDIKVLVSYGIDWIYMPPKN
ncbi:MAG: hypothetical protein E7662_08545 [Ruminococcaceae bacterium]|nr:hypothetical protein [Oscillospiraceae bacterium]